MTMKKLLCLALAIIMVVGVLAGCQKPADPTTTGKPNVDNPTQPQGTTNPGGVVDPTDPKIEITPFPEGDFVWKTSASAIATNWNPHTYQDTVQSVPLDYTTSGLYTFIFNDELHPVEGKAPFEGYVIMPEMAAEMPIDVTAEVKANYPQFAEIIPADINEGYAYKIVLNPDACWDDGTPINAETYVESFKRLLKPELLNYRASNWYGSSFSLAGAENYFNQGKSNWYAASDAFEHYSEDLDAELIFTLGPGNEANSYIRDYVGFPDSYDIAATVDWLTANWGFPLTADQVAQLEGKTLAEIKADEALKALWDTAIGWWQTEPDEELHFFISVKTYAADFSWDNVGLIATGEYELVVVLEKALAGFDLVYNISGLTSPLVKIDLYDSLLKSETGASGVEIWTSTYNTGVDSAPSYGPYKLTEYQLDKSMRFTRNENWWGYKDGKHIYMDPEDGCVYQMYQTTEVYIQYVSESSVSKNMFMAGHLMSYGLQSEDFDELRSSERCYATPGSTIFFLVLNGNMAAIQERENAADFDKATQDLEMLTNTTFHMAMGMTYNKDDFAATVSPARSGALGIIGDAYMYDPDTGARYRDTDQAKQVLCDFYGVDVSKYNGDLDEAVKSITGYNPEQAKVLFTQAFQEGLDLGYITDADGDGKSDQTVRIEYSMSSEVNDFMTKTIKYMNDNLAIVLEGTPFEGKVEFYMSAPYGNPGWSDNLKAGVSDTALCGWSGSLLDPFGLTDLYTNPDYQYDAAWFDATKVDLTINVPVNGENKDVTLTLKEWSDALNGTAIEKDGVTYNYGSGQADVEVRLDILAACEGAILGTYNYLPMLLDGSMALLSYQVYYVVEEYNPIMGRGGLAYTKYNYNETEWATFVFEQGGTLSYA